MNFETMDWDAEAARVALAFGVGTECFFDVRGRPQVGYLTLLGSNSWPIAGSLFLNASITVYDVEIQRTFSLFESNKHGTLIGFREKKRDSSGS